MANDNLAFEAHLHQQLYAFLQALGVSAEPLCQQLAHQCLQHVAQVLPEVDAAKARRIALNQAQYVFDQALAHFLSLDLSHHRDQLTAARAQLLQQKIATDFLFDPNGRSPNVSLTLHTATPPESPLTMPKQRLCFVFGKNPTQD